MDAIDLRLVELLRDNARLSFAELARQVGLSAPAVHERVGKLESSGVIRGYRAEVAPEAIGLGVTALIGIVEDSERRHRRRARGAARAARDRVLLLHGRRRSRSCSRPGSGTIAELEQLIVRLNRTPGVASTRTAIALSTKWENRPQPVDPRRT